MEKSIRTPCVLLLKRSGLLRYYLCLRISFIVRLSREIPGRRSTDNGERVFVIGATVSLLPARLPIRNGPVGARSQWHLASKDATIAQATERSGAISYCGT